MIILFILFISGNAMGQIMNLPQPTQPSSSIPTYASKVIVPEVRGLTVEQARQRLRNIGLTLTVETVNFSQPSGRVIDQDPKPGTRVDPRSQICIVVAGQ
jgi:eukaryotic-like serine/threonine-protein kinase